MGPRGLTNQRTGGVVAWPFGGSVRRGACQLRGIELAGLFVLSCAGLGGLCCIGR